MNTKENLKRAIREESQFELEDIFESNKDITVLISENLVYLLMREKLMYADGDGAQIPMDYIVNYDDYDAKDTKFRFSSRYDIYHKSNIIASGSVLGEGDVNNETGEYTLYSISANVMAVLGYKKTNTELLWF